MPDVRLAPVPIETEEESEEPSERELLQEVLHVLKRIHRALVLAGTAADIDGAGDLEGIEE